MQLGVLKSAQEAGEEQTAQLAVVPKDDRRHAPRRLVNLAAALREQGARTTSVTILNVGSGGCKVRTESPLGVGEEVWLKFEGLEAKRSKVVWSDGGCVGCQFAVPLHNGELEQIAPRKQPIRPSNVFRRR